MFAVGFADGLDFFFGDSLSFGIVSFFLYILSGYKSYQEKFIVLTCILLFVVLQIETVMNQDIAVLLDDPTSRFAENFKEEERTPFIGA